MDREKLISELEVDEGVRLKLYIDSRGNPTIGIGHNLRKGISKAIVYAICHEDIDEAEGELDHALQWWRRLDETRQRALANMCFNLGIAKLREFEKFLGYLFMGDYASAAREMLDSNWAKQVGPRALRLSDMIAKGDGYVAPAA